MHSIRNYFLIAAILFLILNLFYSNNLKIDASSDTLILQNDESFQYFEYYNQIFPSKNFLVLAIQSNKKIEENYIKNINLIQNKLNKIEGVESTFSIVDTPILLLNNITLTDLGNKDILTINNSKNDLDLILNEFSSSPIFNNQIINEEQTVSSIIIYLKKDSIFNEIKKKRKKIIKEWGSSSVQYNNINKKYLNQKRNFNKKRSVLILKIREQLDQNNKNYKYFLGGIDMIADDTINYVKKDIFTFSISVLIFIIIVLFIIFRNFQWVLIPLISTAYAVITMIGFIGFMNWEITAISSNFISLMLILSISMNIHIINNYSINFLNPKITNKLLHTSKIMFWPCFYTALTTIVAFGSLLFSDIKPVIDFGKIMIIALSIVFFSSFTILPLLISFFPNINKSSNLKFSILKNFYKLSIHHSKKILFFNLIIFLVSLVGIYKLNVENSFINYFKSNTEIYKGMKLIDNELGGTTPMDILIKFKDDIFYVPNDENENDIEINEDLELSNDLFNENNQTISWFTNEKLDTIKKIHRFLENRFEIGKVQSLHSLIEIANQINKEKLSVFELSVLYNEIPENYKKDLILPFLSIENNMIKISSRIKDSEKIKRKELIDEINNYLETQFDNIEEYHVNGLLVLYNNMLQSLFGSQIKSFGIILLSIFVMFIILFQSLKISLLGMIPNIVASTFILGLIGLLRIPLDIMTITIAAVTIGIAVDNTIHYLYKIKVNNKENIDLNNSIENTHETVGYAVMTTSLTIAFGFSVLGLSNFIPTILFGLFTALAMIIAMFGVLITLPSSLIRFKL